MTALSIRSAPLAAPSLQDLSHALAAGLGKNYRSVEVAIVDCPDLRRLGCAAAGIGGNTKLIEVGGEPYAHNKKYRDIRFDMAEIAAACDGTSCFALGAGIAHRSVLNGHCGELVPCVSLNSAAGANCSKSARVGSRGEAIIADYASTLHGGIANLFLSDGKRAPIIRISVKERIGEQGSFPLAIRAGLLEQLRPRDEQQLALGGVFELKAGQVRAHIMPDFECIAHKYYDEEKEEVIKDFLQFYAGMGPDLLCFTVLWTGDPTGSDLNLRSSGEHTHFYHRGAKQEGGHYHYDITPEEVEYVGYFNLAEKLYRVNDIYAQIEEERLSA